MVRSISAQPPGKLRVLSAHNVEGVYNPWQPEEKTKQHIDKKVLSESLLQKYRDEGKKNPENDIQDTQF